MTYLDCAARIQSMKNDPNIEQPVWLRDASREPRITLVWQPPWPERRWPEHSPQIQLNPSLRLQCLQHALAGEGVHDQFAISLPPEHGSKCHALRPSSASFSKPYAVARRILALQANAGPDGPRA